MQTSTLTSKGQATIPAEVCKRLGLHPGDRVVFVVDGDEVRLVRKENRIDAAFGICKPDRSLTTDQMDQVIRERAGR